MRTRHASGVADQADYLTALHYFADMHQRFAQMEVRRHDSAAVIDVHDVASQKEVVDQRHDSAIGRLHRLSHCPAKIDAEVTRSQLTVEEPPRTELAGDYRIARPHEGCGPHRRSLV
jgi:hypothetical protein